MHTEKNAVRTTSLPSDPAKHTFGFHERFLAEAARHVQDIELRRISQSRVRGQSQAFHVTNRVCRLAIEAIGGVRKARQHLKGSRQVDLVEAVKQQRTDRQVSVEGDH